MGEEDKETGLPQQRGTCHLPSGLVQKITQQSRTPEPEQAGASVSFGNSKSVLSQIQVPFNAGATLSPGKLRSVPLPEEVTEAASFVKAASPKSPTGQRSRNCMQIGFPLSRALGVK